jgi:hypothetical protein
MNKATNRILAFSDNEEIKLMKKGDRMSFIMI